MLEADQKVMASPYLSVDDRNIVLLWCMFLSLQVQGYCMDTPWILHGYCMDSVWIVYGYCMDTVWIISRLSATIAASYHA
jgi:hypothetical protein